MTRRQPATGTPMSGGTGTTAMGAGMGALKETPIDAQRLAAYRALDRAAERIGMNNYRSGIAAHLKAARSRSTYRPTVTEAHRLVMDAMPAVLDGSITPAEAMAMLHEYDVEKQRLAFAAPSTGTEAVS